MLADNGNSFIMFISNHIFRKILEDGERLEKLSIYEKEKNNYFSRKNINENILLLYRNVMDNISNKFDFDKFIELLPPSLPLIPCFDISKEYNIRPWEDVILKQFLGQPRAKLFEVIDFAAESYYGKKKVLEGEHLGECHIYRNLNFIADGFPCANGEIDHLPSALLNDPEQAHYLNTGQLTLLCPKCGKENNFSSRGILTGEYEYYEYHCCGFFYFFRPYRQIIEDIRSLVDIDGQRIYIIRKDSEPRSNKLIQLLRAYLAIESQIIHELYLLVNDYENRINPEPLKKDSHCAEKNKITLVFGRFNNNPGHVIFEDLAGMIELCELLKSTQSTSKIKAYVSQDFIWYKKLLSLVPLDFLEKVIEYPGGIDSMIRYLNGSNILLDNVMMPEPWPKDRKAGSSTQNILSGLAELYNERLQAQSGKKQSIIFLHRFNNRKWSPVVENTIRYSKEIRKFFPDIEIVIHGVFENDTQETRMMEEKTGISEGLRVLFNPELTVLLTEIAKSSLCIGPIGSGFWWPSIFNKPCITLHPVGDYSNIHSYDWMAAPPRGMKPTYLGLLDHEDFICIEETRSFPRKVYEDLYVDLERVLESSLKLLK